MSRMEEDVRPVLQRLWAPSYPLGRATLAPDEAALAAAWAVKTALVWERALNTGPTIDAGARAQLKSTRLPPPWTTVHVARHVGDLNFTVYMANMTTQHRDDDFSVTPNRAEQVLLMSLVFRGLVVLVRVDTGDGVPQMPLNTTTWTRMWPTSEPILWPPPSVVTDLDAASVVHHVGQWLNIPDGPVFRRSNSEWIECRRN